MKGKRIGQKTPCDKRARSASAETFYPKPSDGGVQAGILACSGNDAFPGIGPVACCAAKSAAQLVVAFLGTYSSGDCPGFTPGSLLE